MKQTITQSQYEELDDRQREKFIEWALSKGDHAVAYRSIGHLIWFLNDHVKSGWWTINKSSYPNVWLLESKYDVRFGHEDRPELIDALWEAVKAILSQEE